MPKLNKRCLFAVKCFYELVRERKYLSGKIPLPLPLDSSLIDNYLMNIYTHYDIMDIKELIIACDDEYIEVNGNSIREMNND